MKWNDRKSVLAVIAAAAFALLAGCASVPSSEMKDGELSAEWLAEVKP